MHSRWIESEALSLLLSLLNENGSKREKENAVGKKKIRTKFCDENHAHSKMFQKLNGVDNKRLLAFIN